MVKRKRELEPPRAKPVPDVNLASKVPRTEGHVDVKTTSPVIQIVVGTYERILHGVTAALSNLDAPEPVVDFADSFLFNAHASAIRCVAISPFSTESSEPGGLYLASGGSDERINVYSLSASPLAEDDKLPPMPTLGNNKISENPGNRELGSLMQHSSNITSLHFPTRSKLIAASEDNTITISRTRDLTVVSTIKAPRPKIQGQPSGDTAPPGATPAGINDFAIHPSMKLMISVGRGERSMRLWNLVTGKKAGVLNFDRSLLQLVKESKYSSGEGRKIRWNALGTEFAVSFERGVVVFGEDSRPKSVLLPQPVTKVHEIAYFEADEESAYLAISTEDGRIIIYNSSVSQSDGSESIPILNAVAQVGGRAVCSSVRIKDFKFLPRTEHYQSSGTILVTASSDGNIRVWLISFSELRQNLAENHRVNQAGKLIGTYSTGNRITCLDAFTMIPSQENGNLVSDFEGLTEEENGSSEESSHTDEDEM